MQGFLATSPAAPSARTLRSHSPGSRLLLVPLYSLLLGTTADFPAMQTPLNGGTSIDTSDNSARCDPTTDGDLKT